MCFLKALCTSTAIKVIKSTYFKEQGVTVAQVRKLGSSFFALTLFSLTHFFQIFDGPFHDNSAQRSESAVKKFVSAYNSCNSTSLSSHNAHAAKRLKQKHIETLWNLLFRQVVQVPGAFNQESREEESIPENNEGKSVLCALRSILHGPDPFPWISLRWCGRQKELKSTEW